MDARKQARETHTFQNAVALLGLNFFPFTLSPSNCDNVFSLSPPSLPPFLPRALYLSAATTITTKMRKSALTFTFFALALVAGTRAQPTVSFFLWFLSAACNCSHTAPTLIRPVLNSFQNSVSFGFNRAWRGERRSFVEVEERRERKKTDDKSSSSSLAL